MQVPYGHSWNFGQGGHRPIEPHLHRASCHGPIGELQCGYPADGPSIGDPMLTFTEEELFGLQKLDAIEVKPRLHWYQWIVYTAVLITCLIVSVSMIETWIVVAEIQEAFENFGKGTV